MEKVKRDIYHLERALALGNEQKIKRELHWVDHFTADKRQRPKAAKEAIQWLKKKNLWESYLDEYAVKKQHGGQRTGAGAPKKEPTKTVSARVSISLHEQLIASNYTVKELLEWALDNIKNTGKEIK